MKIKLSVNLNYSSELINYEGDDILMVEELVRLIKLNKAKEEE